MPIHGRVTKKYIISFVAFVLIFAMIASLFFFIGGKLSSIPGNKSEDKKTNVGNTPVYRDSRVIVIDAGHGGEDGGTVSKNGTKEKDLNLSIAFLIYDMLRSDGYNAILTRSEDIMLYDRNVDYKGRKKMLDLAERVKIAKENDNCVFISIHMNSYPDQKYSGLQVYYSKNDPESQILADTVQDMTRRYLQKENTRKTKAAGSNIYVLDRINSPAVLIECGFLSNYGECAKLCDPTYQRQLAFVIFASIVKYIKSPS